MEHVEVRNDGPLDELIAEHEVVFAGRSKTAERHARRVAKQLEIPQRAPSDLSRVRLRMGQELGPAAASRPRHDQGEALPREGASEMRVQLGGRRTVVPRTTVERPPRQIRPIRQPAHRVHIRVERETGIALVRTGARSEAERLVECRGFVEPGAIAAPGVGREAPRAVRGRDRLRREILPRRHDGDRSSRQQAPPGGQGDREEIRVLHTGHHDAHRVHPTTRYT